MQIGPYRVSVSRGFGSAGARVYTGRNEGAGATRIHSRHGRRPAGPHRAREGAGGVEAVPGGSARRRVPTARRRPDGAARQRQDRAAQLVQARLPRPRDGSGRGRPHPERHPYPGSADRRSCAAVRDGEAAAPEGGRGGRRLGRMGAAVRGREEPGNQIDRPVPQEAACGAARRGAHAGYRGRQNAAQHQSASSRRGAVSVGAGRHAGLGGASRRHECLLLEPPGRGAPWHRPAERRGRPRRPDRAAGGPRRGHRHGRPCRGRGGQPALPVLHPTLGRGAVGPAPCNRRRRPG